MCSVGVDDEDCCSSADFLDSTDSESSMPSRMLEQLAQIFGLRESAFPPTVIDSPQQIQILGIIPCKTLVPENKIVKGLVVIVQNYS
jgi:hypothetical protein